MDSLLDIYHQRIKEGGLHPDPTQERVLTLLGEFCTHLASTRPRSLVARLFGKEPDMAGGFYFYGAVGRGKTMVMDLFFDHVPLIQKRRVHFHDFMLEVHDFMHDRRSDTRAGRIDNDLLAFADKVANEAQLLCFDEFHVKDVADAMILGRLFTALFDRGVAVIMTSNIHPDDLYEDGLQRDRFLPFIELLKQKLTIFSFDGERDYRLGRMRDMQVYYWPHDEDAHTQMQNLFDKVAGSTEVKAIDIEVKGRKIHVPCAAKTIAWFTFAELCETEKSALDYLVLAKTFKALVIENVPHFDEGHRDIMVRFVTLIDALYNHRVCVVLSAAAAAENLYRGENPDVFARTASRLIEMQSKEYRKN